MSKFFTISIDGETFEPPNTTMTANEILSLGGLDSSTHYLIELGDSRQEQISFEYRGAEQILLHEGSKFISNFTGPTTVSDGQLPIAAANLIGAPRFVAELKAEGYDVTELSDHHVMLSYTVEVGKFTGLELKMGFVVPENFPLTPPSGPHINRRLHPNKDGGEHPLGGIHISTSHSKHFREDWQYWSRPCSHWTDGPRSAVRYMSFIRSLWVTQ